MATNNNNKNQVLALFPDNNNYEITARDMRMYVDAIFNDKEVVTVKMKSIGDLSFHNSNIYEGSMVVIYNDADQSRIGIYLSIANQPTSISQLIQLSTIIGGSGGVTPTERGGLLYDANKTYYIGDIVSNNNNVYLSLADSSNPSGIFDSNNWLVISSGSISIIDSLSSTSTTDALSANQGRLLDENKEPTLPSGLSKAGYVLTLKNDEISKEWNPTYANAMRWFSTITYGINNMVEHEGIIYRCLSANTNQIPLNNPSSWYNPYIDEAPKDGSSYWRKDGTWTKTTDYGSF